MFEDDFSELLRKYPEAVSDKKRLSGILKDVFPTEQMKVNLLNIAYELGLPLEISKTAFINNAFAYRFVKQIVDTYGVSRANADWAVAVWCVCYGQMVLNKPCEIKLNKPGAAPAPAIKDIRDTNAGKQYSDLFQFTKVDNGYGVTGFSGQNKKTLIFPNRYNGQPVTQMMPQSFEECEVNEAIMIEGIQSIGEKAFYGCSGLKQVVFPNTVRQIGDSAFRACQMLGTAPLPASIVEIGRYSFAETGLKTVNIPKSVLWIGEGAFEDCKRLLSVTLPDGIGNIPDRLFKGCEALTNIKLPETVSEIGAFAFANCNSMLSLTIPDAVKTIGESAFEGMNPQFTLICPMLSAAEQYARKHDIKFQIS